MFMGLAFLMRSYNKFIIEDNNTKKVGYKAENLELS